MFSHAILPEMSESDRQSLVLKLARSLLAAADADEAPADAETDVVSGKVVMLQIGAEASARGVSTRDR